MELETECDFGLESDDFNLDQVVDSDVNWASNPISPIMEPTNVTSPSSEPSSSLELKALPAHLKYAYLGEQETFPFIIASHLNDGEEEDLKAILRKHREAVGWTMTDIKGLSPTIVQHRIHLNEDATPKRDPQRRLNPIMQEAVHAEIVKLLDNGIIYPISDSQWVSPVHAVPKKSGFSVAENENKELVQTRLPTKIRVCIDYRKLNAATRKDHFPLPFIDQMLERLAGHEYYCFLDDYSGYNQIPIAPEDQEKTTFTCPFGTFAYRRMAFGLCNIRKKTQHATLKRCWVLHKPKGI